MYRKSCCTGGGGGVDMDKMLKFYVKVLYDGQGTVRQAILVVDRSCFTWQETELIKRQGDLSLKMGLEW